MTNKEKVLKEFEDSIQYCPSLDEPNEYCSNMGCEQCYMDNTLPKQKQFISDLLDEAEKEKQEAVQLGYDKAHKEIAKAYIEIEEKELNK